MKCEQVLNTLPDYIQGTLEENGAAIKDHLKGCKACRSEFTSLETLWNKLDQIPSEQPAEVVRERFYTMLTAYEEGLAHSHQAPRLRDLLKSWVERWWPQRPALQMGLALTMLLVGLVAGANFRGSGSQSNGEMAYLHDEIRSMRQMMSLSLLRQDSASDRLRGVSFGAKVSTPDQEVLDALISTVNTDANINVRLAAIEALHVYTNIPQVKDGLIESIALQNSPMVQIELINLLVRIREESAVETFRALIDNEEINTVVRERAQWGLQQMGTDI